MIELWVVDEMVEYGIVYCSATQALLSSYWLTVDTDGELVLVRKSTARPFISCLHRSIPGKYQTLVYEHINLHRDTDD